jgi:hypothetical protein
MGHLDVATGRWHHRSVWWRSSARLDPEAEERFQAVGTMLMRIDRKLDRLLELLEDDDGGEEEEEADRP